MRNHIIVCITSLLLGGCVSIQLPGGKSTPAKDVVWTAPGSEFKELKDGVYDKAWISTKTGNTISYLSDCGTTAEPTLQQLETESLSSLNDVKITTDEGLIFNGRAARSSTASGTLDGVPVRVSLLVFKKNGCNYTLSYGGLEKQFASEERVFENFKNNFKAP